MSDRVVVTIEDHVATVRLNRPEKRNALDLAMFRAIADAQKSLHHNRAIRAVVLCGAGIDFCSGLDIKSAMNDRRGMVTLLRKWLPWRANLAQRVGLGWRELPAPVIAAIQGRCWGGGLQIALGADFRIAAPDASLSIMESKWGLIPDMAGTLALRELIGRDQAMLLAMTAAEITGEEAFRLGLATAVSTDPQAAARELSGQLATRSPDAVNAIKRLYRKSWARGSGAALARETAYQIGVLRRRR